MNNWSVWIADLTLSHNTQMFIMCHEQTILWKNRRLSLTQLLNFPSPQRSIMSQSHISRLSGFPPSASLTSKSLFTQWSCWDSPEFMVRLPVTGINHTHLTCVSMSVDSDYATATRLVLPCAFICICWMSKVPKIIGVSESCSIDCLIVDEHASTTSLGQTLRPSMCIRLVQKTKMFSNNYE
jgi:hypothetical protein